jgi:LytS/YehU family sensor histidine kinase
LAWALLALAGFWLVGPFAWRWWLERRRVVALLVLAGGALSPLVWRGAGGGGFLFAGVEALVTSALFVVGSVGLGRDIVAERRLEAARAEAERARLLARQGGLDPHFLFNVLNALAEWCREDPRRAEGGLLTLARWLRGLLDAGPRDRWPLATELQACRDLLSLYELRDPERFAWTWRERGDLEGLVIPPLLLLPIVENALKHGPGKGQGGPVVVEVERTTSALAFEVRHPGVFGPPRPGALGLDVLRARCALAWGEAARLELSGGDPVLVRLRLPLEGGTP